MKKEEKILIVRLPIDLHAESKVMATRKNQTLSKYVRLALLQSIKKDKDLGY